MNYDAITNLEFPPSILPSPEDVPRLFDLVKPKEDKFLTAFYFALRDTLVAKDLDQATRIGLQVSSNEVQ